MKNNSEITAKPTGFQLHPELINKKGAPKKDDSLTNLVKELLRKKPDGQKKTYRELFAMRVLKLALEGDITAIKTIWSYMDGKPKGSGIDIDQAIIVQPILGGSSQIKESDENEGTDTKVQ